MSESDNTVTFTITLSDADFDELEFVARVMGKTPDDVLKIILAPEKLSEHIKDTLHDLRLEHERLRRQHPEAVRALEVVQQVAKRVFPRSKKP